MLVGISDKKEIAKINNIFKKKLFSFANEIIPIVIGYQGKSLDFKINYFKDEDIWWANTKAVNNENRFWNSFGLGKPEKYKHYSITGEINYPFEGYDRKIAGIWARDEKNGYFLLHSGKIGGRRKGIGKSLFNDNFRGERAEVVIDNETFEY